MTATTFKDASGREWVLVPREATPEMIAAMGMHGCDYVALTTQGVEQYSVEKERRVQWAAALAAAPQFVPPRVADEVAEQVWRAYHAESEAESLGAAMIAAVQQALGPLIGLVPREWVADAYTEGREDADGREPKP